MAIEKSDDTQAIVSKLLKGLGISLLCEWEVLEFLFSHGASLGTAAFMGRYIGYDEAEITVALSTLDAQGLIESSRVSQGIRFYKITNPPHPSRHSGLIELLNLAQNRPGRLLVVRHLKVPAQATRRGPN